VDIPARSKHAITGENSKIFTLSELFPNAPVTSYEHDGAHPLPSLSGYSSYPVTLPGLLKPRLLPLAGVLFCLMETQPEGQAAGITFQGSSR
jgi:hypothetical protein